MHPYFLDVPDLTFPKDFSLMLNVCPLEGAKGDSYAQRQRQNRTDDFFFFFPLKSLA